MPSKPASIDEYLRHVAPEKRAALEKLRAQIHRVLGDAEECISYSMPAFRVRGKVVAGFLATSTGCSYFPFSGSTLDALDAELADYSRTKSALHWQPKRGLPTSLVRLLVRTRLGEIDGARPSAKTAKRPAKAAKRPARAARKTNPKSKLTKKSPVHKNS